MDFRFTIVETSLNRAEFRWKWLRFLQHSFALGGVLSLLVLLFGGAIVLGWVTSKTLATAFFGLLAIAGFVAWMVIIISVAVGTPERHWLGAAPGRGDPPVLDRLHTFLFLARPPGAARPGTFSLRPAFPTQTL